VIDNSDLNTPCTRLASQLTGTGVRSTVRTTDRRWRVGNRRTVRWTDTVTLITSSSIATLHSRTRVYTLHYKFSVHLQNKIKQSYIQCNCKDLVCKSLIRKWVFRSQYKDALFVEAWMEAGRLFHTARSAERSYSKNSLQPRHSVHFSAGGPKSRSGSGGRSSCTLSLRYILTSVDVVHQ